MFCFRTDDFNNQDERPLNRPHSFRDNKVRTGGFRDNGDHKTDEGTGGFRDKRDFNRPDGGGQRQGGFRERRERNSDFGGGRNNDRRWVKQKKAFG